MKITFVPSIVISIAASYPTDNGESNNNHYLTRIIMKKKKIPYPQIVDEEQNMYIYRTFLKTPSWSMLQKIAVFRKETTNS